MQSFNRLILLLLTVSGVSSSTALEAQRQEWGLDATGCVGLCSSVQVQCNEAALSNAVANPKNRIITFPDPCTIDLSSRLLIRDAENLTLDCGDHTTFTSYGLVLSGWKNVIIRGCRFRNMKAGTAGAGDNGDCLTVQASGGCTDCEHQDLQISGNSCLYATDEGFDIQAPADDVAIFDNEINGLYYSEHSKSPAHSYCLRVGAIGGGTAAADEVFLYRNDFIGCQHRVPQIVQNAKVYALENRAYHYGDPSWSDEWFGFNCRSENGTTTEIIAQANLFYPGPDNEPNDLSEEPFAIDEGPGGDCKLFLANNAVYPLDQSDPITAQNALLFSGSRELNPPFNNQPTSGLPSIGSRRGPDANADADDTLVRGGFECYLDHWDPSSILAEQDTTCSFGTLGIRDMIQDLLPLE
ncbi:MAG: hypothetical protein AAF657_22525 [Acidobacteriota bacterium]